MPAQASPISVEKDAVASFLDAVAAQAGRLDPVSVFHAVRHLPYLSTGDRTLEAVLARRAGSCSGKHILLARLLREIGTAAEVELVDGDFATPLRTARNLPPELDGAIATGIPDIHNVVRATVGGRPVVLDATWNDAVKPFGFRVNDGWQGEGDTVVAVDVRRFLGPADDPAAAKAAIIESWPQDVQARRRQFLERINDFVARLTS